jgi:mannose-6-phosphate isomerase
MKPFKFEPILKETLWGGDKIIPFKGVNSHLTNVGESWEVSGVEGSVSVVADGKYKGSNLKELVCLLKDELVGKENYERFGNEFPLLIKFIDARQDLSIQVHPNDEVARKQGKERGKTEMWYVMPSDPNAKLHVGLKQRITPEQYKQMVENDTIVDAIAEYDVSDGDCFFIPAGRIHSIMAGCFLAEIQQTSDVTYRIYDFKRKDKNGNYRQLHTREAAEAIDYTVSQNYRTNYVPLKNCGVRMVTCPYFNTSVYDIDKPMMLDYSSLDSFVVLIGIEGSSVVTDDEGDKFDFRGGETILVPATAKTLRVEGEIRFLETYV